MPIRLAIPLALAALSISPAVAQAPPRTEAAWVGDYAYRDREIAGHLHLRADRTFEYKVDGLQPDTSSEGPFHLLARGVWRPEDSGNLILTNAPTDPPVLRQVSAVRDPAVRAALTIVSSDGRPVDDLGIRTDGGETGQANMVSPDGLTIPLLRAWDTDGGKKGTPTPLPRSWAITRAGDDLPLATIALSPGGPNRFVFHYTPSPIAPFRLAAGPVDGRPDAIEVEFGTASITMERVTGR